jgi:glycosyltransferase involved in cell wall biosynthesis
VTKNKFILVGAKITENDSRGGVGTLSNALVDYADKAGFEVVVINTAKKPFSKTFFLQDIKNGMLRVYQLVTLLRLEKYSGIIIFSSAGWGFYEKIILSAICRIVRVPCVLFIIDGWFLSVRNKSFLKRLWIGLLLKFPHTLAASGLNWLRLFRELGVKESHLATIHYWLPKSFSVALQPKVLTASESIKFIFVGWMIKEKGLHEILAAVNSLFDKYQFIFTFIGDGPMLEDVRQIIKNSKWDSRVFARGWLTLEQKEEELSASHVFVLPSYAEGFPMSLIEAMLSGLPSICTDVGGVSDSLYDGVNGFLIPPKNIRALKEAMEFYILNPDSLRTHSIQASKTAVQNHDADKNCKMLFSVLTKGCIAKPDVD